MSTVLAEFCQRVEGIPFHGMGLSADAYQPDVADVMAGLQRQGCPPDFVELFRAGTPMLAALRRRFPQVPMPYHAEGLWLTRAGWLGEGAPLPGDLVLALEQVRTLKSAWLNHECASKLIGDYPVGTYLPPLFSASSAARVARHARQIQAQLDLIAGPGRGDGAGGALLLLELPPLTYFRLGDRPVGRYFRDLTAAAPCGLVLDIGHLWTHYRYGPRPPGVSLASFVARFLEDFPVERVVEIHVAGLEVHPAERTAEGTGEPWWLDAHGAPIPGVLFDMLEQVLADRRLTALRGVALEVDTKPVELIVTEFDQFRRRFGPCVDSVRRRATSPSAAPGGSDRLEQRSAPRDTESAVELEQAYARAVFGCDEDARGLGCTAEQCEGLRRYREQYLPYELMHWGGDLPQMFPQTCAGLATQGIAFAEFVPFWFAECPAIPEPYDFFLLKLDRFVEFVVSRAPALRSVAEGEAEHLRLAYACANEPVPVAAGDEP